MNALLSWGLLDLVPAVSSQVVRCFEYLQPIITQMD